MKNVAGPVVELLRGLFQQPARANGDEMYGTTGGSLSCLKASWRDLRQNILRA
jgi:hypothetical protein